MTTDFMLPPPPTLPPVTSRVRAGRWLKAQQLKLWLPAMSACESLGLTHWDLYYWFVRRAIRCNSWRFGGRGQ